MSLAFCLTAATHQSELKEKGRGAGNLDTTTFTSWLTVNVRTCMGVWGERSTRVKQKIAERPRERKKKENKGESERCLWQVYLQHFIWDVTQKI